MTLKDNAAASEYLNSIKERYRKASGRKEKTHLLNQYRLHTGRSKKYVIRLLGSSDVYPRERKSREMTYNGKVTEALAKVWEMFDRPCGQRLKLLLDREMDQLRLTGELKVSDEVEQKLLQISSATIDCKLKAEKAKPYQRKTLVRRLAPSRRTQRQLVGRESRARDFPVAVPA